MSVLTDEEFDYLDRLFYDAPALEQAVRELRVISKAAAADSADPTAREAVAGMVEIKSAMGYTRPEAWLRVVDKTWKKYGRTEKGELMRRRYVLRERWRDTVGVSGGITDNTYFRWRREFIISAALLAAREGLM